jgi:DNA-binding response OmpR family regulator
VNGTGTEDTPRRVLIAEDDVDIASTLSRGLSREGYAAAVAHDCAGALALVREGPCDAAIVDMMLGADAGTDLVRHLREGGMRGPILVLSALSSVEDRTDGLEAGADDYIAKPFEFDELLARLKVQEARRSRRGPAARSLGLGGLSLDPELREVAGAGRTVTLTPREAGLLGFLIEHAGEVVSRGAIFDALWAAEGGSSENVVDVYIGYLRRKLAPIESFGVALRTIRGRGFLLTEASDG